VSTTPHGKVLVVEDEGVVADLLEDMLEAIGYADVRHAATVDEALEEIEKSPPVIAILDVNLRGAPAHPVATRLRALEIPFVVATGFDPKKLPSSFNGAVVLRKPFQRQDLEAAITQVQRAPSR
jgi:DNA-binding response OmpR family regulator